MEPNLQANPLRIHVSSRQLGDTRSVTILLTGTDSDFIALIDQLELAVSDGPANDLRVALCRGTGLVWESEAAFRLSKEVEKLRTRVADLEAGR